MTGRLRALVESIRTGFWAIPGACVVLAVFLGLALVKVDQRIEGDIAFAFGAGPDGAREVLSAISTSMMTFTGLVFSITIVVLQLTSSQFSPRVLRTFLRDRQTQLSLGVFVATFAYSVTVLRTVRGGDDDQFVPAVATTAGLVLLLLSVGVFVAYIHHIATAIQVSSIIVAIAAETRGAIDRRYPVDGGTGEQPTAHATLPVTSVVTASGSGVVNHMDNAQLVELARRSDVVLSTELRLGAFVPEGGPLVQVHGTTDGDIAKSVRESITLARDRTMRQDVAFGFRQLVDIGEKALSPGINDPTTAVQTLDQLHDLLRRLATRELRSGVYVDTERRARLITPAETFAEYVELALDEIEQYGRDAKQVGDRIEVLLADLIDAARPEHRPLLLHRQAASRAARRRSDAESDA